MRGRQILFFATNLELSRIIDQVAAVHPLQIVRRGLFDTAVLDRVAEMSGLEPGEQYLVTSHDMAITVRAVPQRKGGTKFAVDQLVNPKTISLEPGGLIDSGCLLPGSAGTASADPVSVELQKLFVRFIKRDFSRVREYWLSQEAERLLDSGIRLTANPRAPVLFDLRRPS